MDMDMDTVTVEERMVMDIIIDTIYHKLRNQFR
jgi:hypothetical protein